MPRKTRKEKYAAKLHKYRFQQQKDNTPSTPPESSKHTVKLDQVQHQPVKSTQKVVTFDEQTRKHFMHDLRKSAVVISTILVLEIALYFSTQAGLLHFIRY